jgi:hypothetical protein
MALVAAFLVFRQIQHFVRYAPSDHS